eukprot:267220-Pyramimonas_sp.AAC.1
MRSWRGSFALSMSRRAPSPPGAGRAWLTARASADQRCSTTTRLDSQSGPRRQNSIFLESSRPWNRP